MSPPDSQAIGETTEMVERVARAVGAALVREWRKTDPTAPDWNGWPAGERDNIRLLARAAIEAMREPTDAMIEAGAPRVAAMFSELAASKTASGAHAISAYRHMISAALGDPP